MKTQTQKARHIQKALLTFRKRNQFRRETRVEVKEYRLQLEGAR